mgnify:FL=1|jgi:hypothetical protein
MDNSHEVAEQVGTIGAVATFLLGLFGIHRHSREKTAALIRELDEKKADRADVDDIRHEIRNFAQQNSDQHNLIMDHLLGGREK